MKRYNKARSAVRGRRLLSVLIALFMTVLTVTAAFSAAGSLTVSAAEAEDDSYDFDPFAEGASYSCVLYNNANGMPTSEANAITQTSDGFIWIGSYGGLVRYDGYRFERMDPSLGLTGVTCLTADRKDRLWIGSNDSGLTMLYRDEVKHWGLEDGLESLAVSCIVEDSKGTVYIATKKGILTTSDGSNLQALTDLRIDDISVGDMKVGADDNIYCLSQQGDFFVLKNGNIDRFYAGHTIPVPSVSCFLPDKSNPGYIYFSSEGEGIYYCDVNGTPKCEKVYTDQLLTNTSCMAYVNNKVWLFASGNIIMLDKDKVHALKNPPMNSNIYHIMEDFEGNMWFTSTRQGVMKLTPNRFSDVFDTYQLESAVVNSTCIYDDKLFIAKDNGLTVIDKNGVCDKLPLNGPVSLKGVDETSADLIQLLNGQRIRSLIEDSDGRMWMSVWSGPGLLCYDHGTLRAYTEDDGLITNKARTVCEMKDGSIVAATNSGVSILKDDKVVRSYGIEDGLENPMILTVEEGADGEILAGSDGGGLYVISKDGSIRTLSLKDGLTSDTILRLKRDHQRDIMWIVTSNSIEYMTPDLRITAIEHFPYTNNFDFIQNSRDEMWVFSSNGIYVVRTEDMLNNGELNPSHYTAANGLSCTPTANSYCCVDDNGDVYLAGTTAVVRMNIETGFAINSDYKAAVPYITADNTRIYPDADGAFRIPSDTQTLTIYGYVFNFSLISPQISYRLEGFSDEYVTVSRDEFAPVVYTNLRGGKYRFVIKVRDPLAETEKTLSVDIVKEKAFYEHPWFFIMAGAVLLMIIIVCFRIIYQKKIESMQRKHKEEVEKERITTELNTATKIQADMLPREFPDSDIFDLYASMDPAKEVGGDFYDFFMTDENHIALVMADVSGKGVPSALFMVIAKTLIKNRAQMGGTPGEILRDVNDQLCEGNEAGLFVTVWLAVIDVTTGKGLAANAGHEHPALMHDGRFGLVEYKHSLVLAAYEGMRFREHEFALSPGDCLFVYTDGVPEATNKDKEMFGAERMLSALNRDPQAVPEALLRSVREDIDAFVSDAEQFDDITMMCFRYKGNTNGQDTDK